MWAGHPDGFLQVNPGWAGHPDGFLQVNTPLLYPSLDPYRQNDRQRNKYTCFAWAGGTCPCFAWDRNLFLFLINTLLLYPSLGPYRQNDRQRNKYTRFAWAGGTCPRFGWAGGTFFLVVLLCQFLVLAGNRFWFYILIMYLEYHTVVVLC